MDQVSYRGYARSIGFDPIKAPTEGLNRMQERDNRVIRNMEENRRAVKEVRDDYSRGLERKLNIESQDRDRNYLYEKSLDENRQKFVEKKAQTLVQNELQRSKNIMSTFESLSKFSTTLADTVTEYKKKQDEAQQAESRFKVATGEIPTQQVIDAQKLFTLAKAAGKSNDIIVAELQKTGASPYLISALMSSNPARKAGIVLQTSIQELAQYPSWALNKLNERGLTTAEQRAAAAPGLMNEFFKERGLSDVNPMLIMEHLQRANLAYNGHVEAARKSDIRNKSDDILSQETKNLIANQTGEQFMTALQSGALTYQEDAATPLGLKGSREYYYNILSDTTLISDAAVENILSTAITDNGQSMKERFPVAYDELMEKRRSEANQEAAQIEATKDRENKVKQEQLVEYARTNNLNEEELTSLIKKAKAEGVPTDLLQAQLAFTTEQQNADFWNKQFREAYKSGTLTQDDVYQPGVPVEVKETWLNRAQELDKRRTNAGIDPALVKAEFTDELKRKLIGDQTDRAAHYSLRSASAYAYNLYNQKFKEYSETMEPGAAAAQARNDVLTAITKGTGRFAVIGSAQANKTQAFYAAFTPGKHPGAPSSINVINTKDVVNRFNANRNIINEEVLVSPTLLKDIDNRIANGKPFSMPEVLNILQRAQPGTTAADLLNAQLKAAGLTQRVKPGFRDTLSRNIMNDPVLQRIFSQPTTQDRLNTTIIGSGNAPATVRTGNSGYYDVVALGSAAGYTNPHVLAAMWAVSNNLGYSPSGVKNDIYRLGVGSQSPFEATKQLIQRIGSTGGTPRQAAMALAQSIRPNDTGFGDKMIKMMQRMGVNVDAMQVSDSSGDGTFNALLQAVIGKESGGRPGAVNPDSGALGMGQVMPANVGPWTQKHLGRRMTPEQFLADPAAQRQVVTAQLRENYQAQLAAGYDRDTAIRRAAAIWYSGSGDNLNSTKSQGGYPSVKDYTMSILNKVNQIAPARNPAFMRPTLTHFYTTSDIGSPGQSHVDIKQQDNPNTPQSEFRARFKENELDNFVVVQDPEFGMIPVGDLRKRLPGRGDNFDQHLARGSHGIDYPTAMGSKLFLRNGAREISRKWTRWGKMSIVQLPDGRRFSFLHGE